MKAIILNILILVVFSGCHKAFLDEPPSKSLVIPKTYQDLNALLQYTNNMNTGAYLYMTSDGDFTFTDSYLLSTNIVNRNTYLWKADLYETQRSYPAWTGPYLQILNANIVLEGLQKLSTSDVSKQQIGALTGNALFFRAMAYTELVLNFTSPYIPEANNQLGLPLRHNSNVSEISQRSTLKETMQFIIEDLTEAVKLLPDKAATINFPGKAAAYTLLSRTFLGMQDYEKSLLAADEAIKIQGSLLDYKDIPVRSPYTFNNPFVLPNIEILFHQRGNQSVETRNKAFQLRIDLYDSYQGNDLRKARFFDNNRNFIGSYSGTNLIFSGITNNEAWLTAAECAARLAKIEEALNYLNTLCMKRYDQTFVPYQSNDKKEILKWILEERRKELVTRSRWFDLRRLNLDLDLAVTLTRTYKGETYTLPPNSSRYTFPIPQEEIDISGIKQNIRTDND